MNLGLGPTFIQDETDKLGFGANLDYLMML